MKILLTAVNAKYIHSNLAVYSLKAYAGKYSSCLEIAEYTINQSKDEIVKGLFEQGPDVLCFSCYIWNISYIKDIISDISQVLPNVPIWVGGPEVSYNAVQFLRECKMVTGVMRGEGEETFLELVEYYMGKRMNFEDIKGLTYRKGDALTETPGREPLPLSRIPFPYQTLEGFQNKIIYYETSRGCPFSCSYCLSSIDKKLRFRDLNLVKKELGFFLEHRVAQVKFVDRTFNCRHSHSIEIWKYLIAHDNNITNFHFEVAADLFNQEEIELLSTMRPGLIQLEIGVQSTNDLTIQEIHRHMNFEAIAQVVERIQEAKNIHQHLDLIAGLPYEDYNSFQESFHRVYALRPNQLQLGFLKVLKGSDMHRKAKEYECRYQQRAPYEVLSTKWLSYCDMIRLKGVEEMVEVYYNSNQFSHTLLAVEQLFQTPFSLYETLFAFYKKKGYLGVSHTRIRRYEILLEFLEEEVSQIQDIRYYKELLTFDFYVRENAKSRPGFAKNLDAYKDKIRKFYREEEQTPRYLKEYKGYQARQLLKMTHIEVFAYDVLGDFQKKNIALDSPCYILFDYKKRCPLTNDAAVYPVEPFGHNTKL